MVVHDFAGQRMYYVLHQILLTVALTRYVVGVSLEHDLDEPLTDPEDRAFGMTHRQNLEFWLNSIHSCAPTAPVAIVCTKADLVDADVRAARVSAVKGSLVGRAYEAQIAGQVLCVSSKTREGVQQVREMLATTPIVLAFASVVVSSIA